MRVGKSPSLEVLGEECREREGRSSEAVLKGLSERERDLGDDGRAGLGMAGGTSGSGDGSELSLEGSGGGGEFEEGSEADFALSLLFDFWNIFESFEDEAVGGLFALLVDIKLGARLLPTVKPLCHGHTCVTQVLSLVRHRDRETGLEE